MTIKTLRLLIKKIQLQLLILQIQFQIAILKKKRTVPNLKWPTKIILHHGGGWLDFDGVNRYHRMIWGFKSSLGYYSGYTIFIERDGSWIQARADTEEGAHTKGYNKRTIGIGLMGDGTEKDFTPAQYATLKKIVDGKRAKYNIPKFELWGHNNFANTLCPSKYLIKWILTYK